MTTSGEDKERAALEAARWLVVLEEEPGDAAVHAEFDAWLKADPANAVAWAETADIYDLMAKTPPVHKDHWSPFVVEREQADTTVSLADTAPADGVVSRWPLRKFAGRRIALGVAAVMVAACLALVIAPTLLLRIQADYMTLTAELRTLSLADGSMVHLAPNSAIAVDFDTRERRVRLVKGEAFFEVTPDIDRPFRVATREVTSMVLGTAFDVRLGEDGTAVAVRQGRVSVNHPAARPPVSERLDAGDWMRVGWNGDIRRGQTPPDEIASWVQGQIVARDRRLEDVVDDLRRYYTGMIFLISSTFGEQRVSGVYNVNDPVSALTAMAGAHGGTVHQISPWVLVITGG